jgi:hypothetical protein
MKLTRSTKRRASWGVITIILQQKEAKSLAPPEPGKRTLGLAQSPMTVELRLPYMSIWAPPRKV